MEALIAKLVIQWLRVLFAVASESLAGKRRPVDKASPLSGPSIYLAIIIIVGGTTSYFFKEAAHYRNHSLRLEAILREKETTLTSSQDCPVNQEELLLMVEQWDDQREFLLRTIKDLREDPVSPPVERSAPPRRTTPPRTNGSQNNTGSLLNDLQKGW